MLKDIAILLGVLALICLLLGGAGGTDYADARLQEKDICSHQPHPGWCAHADQ